MKGQRVAAFGFTLPRRRLTGKRDLLPPKTRLVADHGTGTALTLQAMAHRNAGWFALNRKVELPATTGGAARGHCFAPMLSIGGALRPQYSVRGEKQHGALPFCQKRIQATTLPATSSSVRPSRHSIKHARSKFRNIAERFGEISLNGSGRFKKSLPLQLESFISAMPTTFCCVAAVKRSQERIADAMSTRQRIDEGRALVRDARCRNAPA